MGRGKPISSEVRNVLYKVLTYFEMEKRNKYILLPLHRALKRTAIATGVPERTIRNIKKEALEIKAAALLEGASDTDTINFSTTPRKRKSPKKRLDIDDAMIDGIRNIINRFQTDNKEVLTVKKILLAAKNEYNFPGQIDTLRRLLKEKLGCKFKKCDNGRWELILGKSQDRGKDIGHSGKPPGDCGHIVVPGKPVGQLGSVRVAQDGFTKLEAHIPRAISLPVVSDPQWAMMTQDKDAVMR